MVRRKKTLTLIEQLDELEKILPQFELTISSNKGKRRVKEVRI